ncbi:hypothetical protein FGG78_09775 [Thioclava sp. BHET1]|nr:hypothetical protein FGG78_09775 [Thioclava sp. BHET1]
MAQPEASGNPPLIHPGPRLEPRVQAVRTRTQTFEIALKAGESLEAGILAGFARAGLTSGFVELSDLDCARIDFVFPAHSPSPERLAWYSSPQAPEGPARIHQGYMSVGRYQGAGFTHCHGTWALADGTETMGHLLSHQTVVAQDCTLRATGFVSALFERLPDAETRFEIFAATGDDCGAGADAIVLTLRPNTDIPTACAQLCDAHGITRARIVGLGSLNGAVFHDATRMRDHASEFLIREGRFEAGQATLDICVIDSESTQFTGQIIAGGGGVSVTAELVILPI